jgi:25S rRNA (adenine2142-N1)-methyltransferase
MPPNNRKKRPMPLAPKPNASRKKARQVTTLFHKLTQERDLELSQNNQTKVEQIDQQLEEMGGREEYQRASQLSASFHSTSKWVLGSLARSGWLHGIPLAAAGDEEDKKQKKRRRTTRLLEVGAINTELLDGAAQTVQSGSTSEMNKKYNLNVRAIDIHSMEKRIEEHDFLTLPYTSSNISERYDVIVCSMVLNSVTDPKDRGKMCAKLFHHLRPGGKLYLTVPKFCLTKSAFLTPGIFLEMLGKKGIGFVSEETKESPRLSFFILRRPEEERTTPLNKLWKKQIIRRKGKKFPNQFSVVLNEKDIFEQE